MSIRDINLKNNHFSQFSQPKHNGFCTVRNRFHVNVHNSPHDSTDSARVEVKRFVSFNSLCYAPATK
jgi:hypothetical protein